MQGAQWFIFIDLIRVDWVENTIMENAVDTSLYAIFARLLYADSKNGCKVSWHSECHSCDRPQKSVETKDKRLCAHGKTDKGQEQN